MRWASLLAGVLVAFATPAGAAPALRFSSARWGNVFLTTEAPVVTLTVIAEGAPVQGRLGIAARDAYGARAGDATVMVDLPAGASVSHDLTLPRDRLGLFRIEAGLLGGGLAVVAETTAAIVPPVPDGPADASAMGYYFLPARGEWAQAVEIAGQMRRLGIRWVRMTFDWWLDARPERPDTTDPAWLSSTDFELWTDAFRAQGIEVVGTIFGVARWASSTPDAPAPPGALPRWGIAAPRDLDDWELMVGTLAARLRGRVRAWEVWNEPDIQIFWTSTADQFAALVQRTSEVLRAVDPEAKLFVSPVDRRGPYGRAFQKQVYAKVAGLLDVFGFHYGWDDWLEFAGGMRSRLRPDRGEVWNTEAFGAPRRHISWWLWQRVHGVDRVFPFIYHADLDDRFWIEGFSQFGLYPVNLDYTPREAAVALRTLADQVGSAIPVGYADVGLGYRTYTFTRPEGPVVALVDPGDELWTMLPEYRLRITVPRVVRRITVVDLMGNPRSYRVRRGKVRLRLRGVAAFLVPELGQSLDGLAVTRRRRVAAR